MNNQIYIVQTRKLKRQRKQIQTEYTLHRR